MCYNVVTYATKQCVCVCVSFLSHFGQGCHHPFQKDQNKILEITEMLKHRRQHKTWNVYNGMPARKGTTFLKYVEHYHPKIKIIQKSTKRQSFL